MIDGYDFWNLDAEKYWAPPKKDTRELAYKFIFSGEYIGSRKCDGHWFMFGKELDGTMWLRSRTKSTVTKDYSDKIEWVPQISSEMSNIPCGTIFLGEIFFPKNEGSKNVTTIMGCLLKKALDRQKTGEQLHYYIFDILAYAGKNIMKEPIKKRIDILNGIKTTIDEKKNSHIHFATFYRGEELWNYVLQALAKGYEGVVIQHEDAAYCPGNRTARKSLKIKKEIVIEIDAFLTGNIKPATLEYKGKEPEHWNYWMNVRTGELLEGEKNYDRFFEDGIVVPVTKDYFYGLPGSVEFGVLGKDGEDVSLCWISNITDDIKWQIKESENNLRGRVAKITAMEVDDKTMSLRHSKIKEWRGFDDKDQFSCTLDQVLNLL